MRIQFCHNCTEDFVAEFEVAKAPTPFEADLIYGYIYREMGKWEEEHEDFAEFDFWQCCYDAVSKVIKILDNPVVTTFYI